MSPDDGGGDGRGDPPDRDDAPGDPGGDDEQRPDDGGERSPADGDDDQRRDGGRDDGAGETDSDGPPGGGTDSGGSDEASSDATDAESDGESPAADGDAHSHDRLNEWDESDGDGGDGDGGSTPPPGGPGRDASDAALTEDIEQLRSELNEFREDIEDRTAHREDVEAELRSYIRWRLRRGHAAGWGPYVVLLYGTLMTLGAFYYLQHWTAILAMIVIWLSTLGLYVVMIGLGIGLTLVRKSGQAVERVRDRR